MPYQQLRGQKALVTGANSGIGESIAKALGAAGAEVVVNYITAPEAAHRIVEEIKAGGADAMAIRADVSKEDEVRTMFREMVTVWGTIDILVNNAGVSDDAPFTEMTLEQWNRVLGVNLTSMFLCAREAAREMVRRGIQPEVSRAAGKIICISSVQQERPRARRVNYTASKGGVKLLMESLAKELGSHRIRVNSIAPGNIQTLPERAAAEKPEALNALLKSIPYGRIGLPEDIAEAAVWLASDASDYVHGHTLFVDGGMSL